MTLFDPALFAQPYMQNALLTGTIAAILAGVVGFFVVVRGISFAAHAVGQIGFAGAAGAVLLNLSPLAGLVVFAIGGAVGIGLLGERDHGRDVVTALILVFGLGVGALFLTLNTSYATAAFSLLFGSIVGINRAQVWQTAALTIGCLALIGVLYRPLVFSSVSADVAAARGVRVRLVGVLFLVIVGIAAAVTIPVAGTLLIFALMVGPGGAAVHLSSHPIKAPLIAVGIGLLATWVGIILAYDTGWPVGVFITAVVATCYGVARVAGPRLPTRMGKGHIVDGLA